MISEHDRIILAADLPEERLHTGDVGTVVHKYSDGETYEVEFLTLSGETVAVVTLTAAQIRPVGKHEITHARSLA